MARRIHPLHVDLASAMGDQLSVSGLLALGSRTAEDIAGRPPDATFDDRRIWNFFESYTAKQVRHCASARLEDRDGKLELAVNIFVSDGHVHDESRSTSGFLTQLSEAQLTADLRCRVRFTFEEKTGSPLFDLPAPKPASPGGVELRGVRFAVLDESGEVAYSIILERPLNRRYFLTVGFERREEVSEDLITAVAARGIELASVYFSPKRRSSSRRRKQKADE